MEDDEDRQDEEQHRGQRVARPQLEQQVLARERADVGEVAHAASRAGASQAARHARVMGGDEERPLAAELGELCVEELGSRFVEGAVRLVQDEQLRVVEEDPAEREPLSHATGVRRHPVVPASQSPNRSSSIPIRSRRSAIR